MNKKKTKPAADFSGTIGDERKKKLKRIAEEHNRSMNGQLCAWIDETPDPEEENKK